MENSVQVPSDLPETKGTSGPLSNRCVRSANERKEGKGKVTVTLEPYRQSLFETQQLLISHDAKVDIWSFSACHFYHQPNSGNFIAGI